MDDPQVGKQGKVFGAQNQQGAGGQFGQAQALDQQQSIGVGQPVVSQPTQPGVGQSQQPVQPITPFGVQDKQKLQASQQPQKQMQGQGGVSQVVKQPKIQQPLQGEQVQQKGGVGASLGGQEQVGQPQNVGQQTQPVSSQVVEQQSESVITESVIGSDQQPERQGAQTQQVSQQAQNQGTLQQQQQPTQDHLQSVDSAQGTQQQRVVTPSRKPEVEPARVDVGDGDIKEISGVKPTEAVDQSQVKQELSADQPVAERIRVTEIPKEPEISEEVQAWMERVKSDDVVDPQPVKHGKTTVVSPAAPQDVEIELPVTEATYEKGFKYKMGYSLRWLVEWCKRVIGVHEGKTGFKKPEQ